MPSKTKSAKDHARARRFFRVRQPCHNCPFLLEGAIALSPGRLDGIKRQILGSDLTTFQCHETTDGEWDEDFESYVATGNESMCAGAGAYLYHHQHANVAMRLAFLFGFAPDYAGIVEKIDTTLPPEESEDDL